MEPKTTSALLYLDGITVSFDGFKALNELSFLIEPREMRAIIGPNGAGKTTMMDVITGKTRPDAGDVYFEQGSYDLSKLDETEIAELGIGRKFQKPTVFDMHSVEDNLLLAFFRNDMGFGGNNGFTDFKDILGFDLHSDGIRVVLLVITVAALAGSYLLCRYLVSSRAGRVMRAIRDAESRTRFLGYPVESYKLWAFVISAVIAGVAGALYVPQVGIINPSEFAPINSIEVVIWVAVGGRGTLYGAIAGAVLVNYAKTYLTGAFPEVWLFALGALFVMVTLFLPNGLAGLLPDRRRASGSKRALPAGVMALLPDRAGDK